MHNSANEPNAGSNGGTTGQAPLRLLKGSDASSTCLGCHEAAGLMGPTGHYVSTPDSEVTAGMPPKQLTPGGDFGWLKRSILFKNGTAVAEDGATHGHNIVAADKGYTAVTGNSPGGSYPASSSVAEAAMTRTARQTASLRELCHAYGWQDSAPIRSSGSYANSPIPAAGEAVGVYRLLAGKNYVTGPVTFQTYPIAVAPATYNQSEATNQVRVAYGASGTNTWGNWCATCHGRCTATRTTSTLWIRTWAAR